MHPRVYEPFAYPARRQKVTIGPKQASSNALHVIENQAVLHVGSQSMDSACSRCLLPWFVRRKVARPPFIPSPWIETVVFPFVSLHCLMDHVPLPHRVVLVPLFTSRSTSAGIRPPFAGFPSIAFHPSCHASLPATHSSVQGSSDRGREAATESVCEREGSRTVWRVVGGRVVSSRIGGLRIPTVLVLERE